MLLDMARSSMNVTRISANAEIQKNVLIIINVFTDLVLY